MGKMVFIQLKDYDIELESNHGDVGYISIYKDGYGYIVGFDEGENLINKGSEDVVLYSWDRDNIEDKEAYISFFPDYPYVYKHIGSSMKHMFNIIPRLDTYDSFISYLKNNDPILPEQEEYTSIYGLNAYSINGTIVAFFGHCYGSVVQYRIGNYEYVIIKSGTNVSNYKHISFNQENTTIIDSIDKYVPFYHTVKKILSYSPTVKHIQHIVETIYDICKYVPFFHTEKKISYSQEDIYDIILHVLTKENPIPKDIAIESPSPDSPWICIHSPESQRTEENDGIPPCTILIRENEWNSIVSVITSYPDVFKYTGEYTDGGYAASISIDLPSMIKQCKVIKDLSPDVISFIQLIEDNTFVSKLRDRIEYIRNDIPRPLELRDIISNYIDENNHIKSTPQKSYSSFSYLMGDQEYIPVPLDDTVE